MFIHKTGTHRAAPIRFGKRGTRRAVRRFERLRYVLASLLVVAIGVVAPQLSSGSDEGPYAANQPPAGPAEARIQLAYGNTIGSVSVDGFQLTSIPGTAVTPEQISAAFVLVGADLALHGDGSYEDPLRRAERIAGEINSGLRAEAEVRQAIVGLASGQRLWLGHPESFPEIVGMVRGFFGMSGVSIQTSIESEDARLARIAGQIVTGQRTLVEVQWTVGGIAAGRVGFDPNGPAQFGGTGGRTIDGGENASVSSGSGGVSAPVVATTTPALKLAAAAPTTTATTSAPQPKATTTPTTTAPAPKPAAAAPTTTATTAGVTTTQSSQSVSGVVVRVGESIQAAVNAHPGGTTFVIKSGVHKRQSVVPKTGDTFVGESGAVLSGENATSYAFGAEVSNVTVKNLVIEKYAGPKDGGAIVTLGGADGWRIEGNEIRYNKGSAIRSGGTGWHIVGNYLHHNEVYGMTGTGVRMVIEDNEIAFNNYQKTSGGNAGGSKWFYTNGLVVRNNYSHDNGGPGLWTDGHNKAVLYDGNRVVNNTESGIKHEASCDAVIRNNTVEGNGFASGEWMAGGIRVSLSPDVEVHHNVVSNNRNGVTAVYSHRSYADTWCSGPDGQHQLKNLWVHDNAITMPTGQTGVVASAATDQVFGAWNNRFDRNTYVIGTTTQPFVWRGDKTIAEWKAAGQDPNSTWK